MHTTEYPDLFVTYRENFRLNPENKNLIVFDEDLSFSQSSRSWPLVSLCK